MRFATCLRLSASCLPSLLCCACSPRRYSQEFDRVVIDANFPGAYQVEVADVNGDKKPDVIAVGGSTCAWYENPTWKKRIVTDAQADARHHLERNGRPRRRRQGRDRHRLRVRDERAEERASSCWRCRGARSMIPGRLCRLRRSAAFTGCAGATSIGDKRPDLVVASLFGPDARPPAYADAAPVTVFRKLDWRGGTPPKARDRRVAPGHARDRRDRSVQGWAVMHPDRR